VLNLTLDPAEPRTKDPNMRSTTIGPFDAVGRRLKEAGVAFEFAEYLKGETHYVVVTIKKSCLLEHGLLAPHAHTACSRAHTVRPPQACSRPTCRRRSCSRATTCTSPR
jgi:hypothetical protein